MSHQITKELPNIDYLKQCFLMNKNGELFWMDRPAEHFGGWYGYKGWNKKYAGKRADTDMRNGYFAVCVNGVRYKSHRVVFAIAHGSVDSNLQIDHANGDTKDNRPENLREATQSQNSVNFKGARSDNTKGARGVTWNKGNKKWESSVFFDGKRKYIGLFEIKEEAIRVSAEARKLHFGEFWESRNE